MTRASLSSVLATGAFAVIVLGAPLLYSRAVFHPFGPPKLVALGFAASLVILVLGLQPRLAISLGRPVVAVLVLAAVFGMLAVAFSPVPAISFWGRANKEIGFLLMVYSLLAYLAGAFATRLRIQSLDPAKLALVPAVPIIIFTVAALLGMQLPQGLSGEISGRPYATLGNPIHMGGYLAAAAAISLGAALGSTPRWRVALLFLGALCIAGVTVSGSRGAFLGLAVGIGLIASLNRGRRKAWPLFLGVLVLLTVTLGIASMLNPSESILRKVLNLSDPTFYGARWNTWWIALQSIGSNPMLGVGPGNFQSAFFAHLTPSLVEKYFSVEFLGDAHSWPLELAVTYGVPFAALFGWLFLRPIRRLNRLAGAQRHLYVACLVLLVAYLFQPLALSTWPLIALFAGAASTDQGSEESLAAPRLAWHLFPRMAVSVVLAALALWFPVTFALMDRDMRQGRLHEDAARLVRAAKNLHPQSPSPYLSAGRLLSFRSKFRGDRESGRQVDWAFGKAKALDPGNPTVELEWAMALQVMDRDETAISHLRKALEIYPGWPVALRGIAFSYLEQKRPEIAIPILEDLVARYPGDSIAVKLLQRARSGGQTQPLLIQ